MQGRRTRSRGACANCKKRKRKCDQTRPGCLACSSRHIPCDGYELKLQWGCGVASRGRLAGSNLPTLDAGLGLGPRWTKSDTQTAANYQVSDTNRHVEDFVVDDHDCERDDHLLTKFLESGIYSLFATSTDDSLKDNLRQASKQSLALVSICCAYQFVSEYPETEEAYSQFRNALRVFQDELEERGGTLNGGTLCAGLILCTLSILQDLPWTNQLHCMVDLYCIHASLGSSAPMPDAFTNRCLQVIGVMDLPGLVFGRRTSNIGFWKRLREAELASCSGLMGGVETLTGLPRSLLDILAYTKHCEAQRDLWNWHGEMGDSLQAQLWDAWRYAGILYRARAMVKNQDLEGDGLQEESMTGLPSTKYLLWRLIASLDTLRLGLEHPGSKGLLYGNSAFWPYLVARCEFELLRSNPEWKTVLDKLFSMMISSYKPGHIQIAQDMIQEAWERGEVTFDLDEAALSRKIELAAF
ncbi:hypothetical protein NXS19_004538 [Fusarium pseudograminearum]|nr:hypothetical protein NXS19_004538 [Fusarium pseudograminearum]